MKFKLFGFALLVGICLLTMSAFAATAPPVSNSVAVQSANITNTMATNIGTNAFKPEVVVNNSAHQANAATATMAANNAETTSPATTTPPLTVFAANASANNVNLLPAARNFSPPAEVVNKFALK